MTDPAERVAYPKRDPYFSHRFMRLLAETRAAQEIGSLSAWLLTVIVLQEDAGRYRRAVTFWDEQLTPLLGVKSLKVLRLAREKAVEFGWLHYEAGSRARPGRYWVTTPNLPDSEPVAAEETATFDVAVHQDLSKETESPKPPTSSENGLASIDPVKSDRDESAAQSNPNRDLIEVNSISNGERTGQESGTNRARTGQPFLPIPIPNPIPNSEENRAPPAATCGELESPSRKSNSTKRRPLTASDVALPPALDSPEFRQALASWFTHRAEIRRPVTETSAKQLIKQLASIGRGRAIAAIEHSVAQGWQGVFEPTQGSQNGHRGTSTGSFNSGRYISPNADEDISRLVRVRASAAETDSGR